MLLFVENHRIGFYVSSVDEQLSAEFLREVDGENRRLVKDGKPSSFLHSNSTFVYLQDRGRGFGRRVSKHRLGLLIIEAV